MSGRTPWGTFGLGLLLASLVAVGPGWTADLEVKAEVWPSPAEEPTANAPERGECVFLRAGEKAWNGEVCPGDGALATRPSFGVAFSGGGTRSASATLGQLRALHALGLDRRLQYISAVSGGSWAAVPYTFLPEDIDDSTFLGPYIPPQAIDDATLESIDERTLGGAITHADLAQGFLEAARHLRSDESYAGALEQVFLTPFRLGGDDPPRFFTLDEGSLARILARNHTLSPQDFHLARPGRPFLIVGGAVVGDDPRDRYPFDMTPLYVGTPFSAVVSWQIMGLSRDLPVGGGYVESFAYDSDLEQREDDGARPVIYEVAIERGKNRFSLSDVIATSGAAPVDRTARFGLAMAKLLGFPQYEHWPMDGRPPAHLDYNHGDGGLVDNVGLMPLLARRVENIIVFVNTRHAFAPSDADGEGTIYPDVARFFEQDLSENRPDNGVFENGDVRLRELREAFARQQSQGQPLVHCAAYQVRPNPRYNIHARYQPTVCWVYLDASEAWFREVRTAFAERGGRWLGALAARQDPFERLPHYETFFENGEVRALWEQVAAGHIDLVSFTKRLLKLKDSRVIKLQPAQVAALANLAAWTVCESADTFRSAMPDVFLPGETPRCDGS
jgi:hypothetical protein